jgi:autotransporter translocation and assembly factor TamB
MTDTNTTQQETEYAAVPRPVPPPVSRQNAVTFMLPAEFAQHFAPQVEELEVLLAEAEVAGEADPELAEGDLDEDLLSEADPELAEGDLDEDL